MKLSEKPKNSPIVSLTPLIDVVFILLIFFMLVSQFMQLQQQSMPLSVAGEASNTASDSVSIRIINNQSAISYQVNSVSMRQQELAVYLQNNKVAEVLLMPEANISLQTFINVKERLSRLGIKKINSEFIGYEVN
ncbi:ExbD/TolR family protein [Cognaticolwellia mytili]|uniref:ExbD/TolR family protein n=1 Tax=Cognaticolwellia mytili TaxID=1888913 RepID=UPI000A176EAB|nr:biopolymer transporter ExbD [Cognaticolwellia mytili]